MMSSVNKADELQRIRRNSVARDAALDAEAALILAAVDAGCPQKDIAEAAGRTREWVRLLVRKHRGAHLSAAS
jgi:predicted transcriptional regulator